MADETNPANDGAARFREAMATVGRLDPVANRERLLLRGGAAGMALGVVWVAIAYFVSHGTRNPLQQRDAFVAAMFGLTVAVVSAAVYLRYSFGRFLRFWLARLSYEQQQQQHREAPVESQPR